MFSDSYHRLVFTIAILSLAGMVGCDTVEVEKPSKRAKSSGEKPIIMRKGTVSTSGNDPCPEEADHCRDATYSERQDIIQSLDLQIRKDDPVCEDLYQSAKQFVNNGTITIFPENTFDGGDRVLGVFLEGGSSDAISFSQDLWTGWKNRRASVAIHEEAHRQGFNETGADYYDDFCIMW